MKRVNDRNYFALSSPCPVILSVEAGPRSGPASESKDPYFVHRSVDVEGSSILMPEPRENSLKRQS
jgi:hypothetical protein